MIGQTPGSGIETKGGEALAVETAPALQPWRVLWTRSNLSVELLRRSIAVHPDCALLEAA